MARNIAVIDGAGNNPSSKFRKCQVVMSMEYLAQSPPRKYNVARKASKGVHAWHVAIGTWHLPVPVRRIMYSRPTSYVPSSIAPPTSSFRDHRNIENLSKSRWITIEFLTTLLAFPIPSTSMSNDPYLSSIPPQCPPFLNSSPMTSLAVLIASLDQTSTHRPLCRFACRESRCSNLDPSP